MVDNPNANGNTRPSEGGGDRNRGGRSRRRRRGKKSGGGEGEQARGPEGGEGRNQDRGQSQARGQGQGQGQPGQQGPQGSSGGQKKRRGQGGGKNKSGKGGKPRPAAVEEKPVKPLPKPREHIIKRYAILIYDNFNAAHADLEKIKEATSTCDQLNVVIRAEGNMEDPELTAIDKVKVFAGTAWTTIHERRIEDGWYTEPR